MSGGYWVFASGGLFDSAATESPALFHVVNLDGQCEALDGGTLCGWSRFKKGGAGGAWRPSAAEYVARGDANIGIGGEHPQVCAECCDRLIWLAEHSLDWDAFKERFSGRKAA